MYDLLLVGGIHPDHLPHMLHNYFTMHTVQAAVSSVLQPFHQSFIQLQTFANAHKQFNEQFGTKADPHLAYSFALQASKTSAVESLMDTRKMGPLLAASLIDVYEKNTHLSAEHVSSVASGVLMKLLYPFTFALDRTYRVRCV